jgi:hypothetical protein
MGDTGPSGGQSPRVSGYIAMHNQAYNEAYTNNPGRIQ